MTNITIKGNKLMTIIGVLYAWGLWKGDIAYHPDDLTFLDETDIEIMLDVSDTFTDFYTNLLILHGYNYAN